VGKNRPSDGFLEGGGGSASGGVSSQDFRGGCSQCDTSHVCHTCDISHTCHKYCCHVPFDVKCVIGGLLITNFNKFWG
jgi:hypothetical protein